MYLITGGTGSFGQTMLWELLKRKQRVRVFSRDEAKQEALRRAVASRDVEWIVGDTRDEKAVLRAFCDIEFAFHAAALKQVPSCELNPLEAVKTNILGSENVIRAAQEKNIEALVVLSTDKAVYPINAMGISKAMMERLAIAAGRDAGPRIMVTRYGNVMMSRGSVIPLFIEQMKMFRKVTLTSPDMTRFMMSLQESVDLVLHAFQHGKSGDLFVKQAPSATVETLVQALEILLGFEVEREVIGSRHGEKMHESLLTAEELSRAENSDGFYRVPLDDRGLNYQSEHGGKILTQGYTSADALLYPEQLAEMLAKVPEIQKALGLEGFDGS